MNTNKIGLLYIVEDPAMYEESLVYIQELAVPEGYVVEVTAIASSAGSTSQIYNRFMQTSDAKYKFYLQDSVFILDRELFVNALQIFQSNDTLGMLGVIGSKTLPSSGHWWDSEYKYGQVNTNASGKMQNLSFQQPTHSYEQVLLVDGLLLMTQHDVAFSDEDHYSNELASNALCLNHVLRGWKVGVIAQAQPICLHDSHSRPVAPEPVARMQAFNNKYAKFIYDTEGNLDSGSSFHYRGNEVVIEDNVLASRTDALSVGSYTVIRTQSRLEIRSLSSELPLLSIGEYSEVGQGCQIRVDRTLTIGNHVRIGQGVIIEDVEGAGIAGFRSRLSPAALRIQDGVSIGPYAVIAGNVSIGTGSVIDSHSYVTEDVPAYARVGGSPARITHLFNKCSGTWQRYEDEESAHAIQEANETAKPFISLCIPTYMRANHLRECLDSIYSQIGNDDRFEVVVCNNDSPDHTETIVQEYVRKYNNLSYFRNPINIGGDANIAHVMEVATGRYLMPHGDDDFFTPGTLYDLYNMVAEQPEAGLFFLNVLEPKQAIHALSGMPSYLEQASVDAAFISSLIIKQAEYVLVEERTKYLSSCLNQVYIQYSILENNPNFVVRFDPLFTYGENLSGGYSWAQVFIRNYLNLMQEFVGRGLTELELADNKRAMLPTVYKWFSIFYHNKMSQFGSEQFESIFREQYEREPYFNEAYQTLQDIKQLR